MSWLLVSIIARFIGGSSAVADKAIIKKSYTNPIGYTFWIGILEALAFLLFLPFGIHLLGLYPTLVAFAAGGFFIISLLFYFFALSLGEASNTIVLIGALSPISTLIWSSSILNIHLHPYQSTALMLLIVGSFIIFLAETEKKKVRIEILLLALVSAFFFGLSNTLSKDVFMGTNFVNGFIFIKIGGFLTAVLFLLLPYTRRKILHPEKKDEFHNRWGYFANRIYGGVGSALVYYAISLGVPALVDATSSLQYVFVFLGGWLILKEKFSGWALLGKILALVIISAGLIWLAAGDYLRATTPNPNRPIVWGVTFSEKFSQKMGLDWKKNYDAIVNDLGIKRLRLIAYWDLIEKQKGQYDFADLDYQINFAEKNGAKVILAIGQKVPRWPECHLPQWLLREFPNPKSQFPNDDYKKELLRYVEVIVNRYRHSPSILYWQVENEPFLRFGECPPFDTNLLDKEMALLKSLDRKHPILMTDSGELSLWFLAAQRGDVFGTTMYRRVYDKVFGAIDYNLPPEFFRLKEKLARAATRDSNKRYIVAELGAEPWLLHQLYETTVQDQLKVFDLSYFKDTVSYAKAAGFDEYYLWGAEWWYWMKEKQGDSTFWDFAETVFRSTP